MQLSQLPTKFPIPFGANAGGGYINTIPQASQPGGRASLNDGFPPANFIPVGAGGVPPFGADFNGLLNQITLWTRWQNAGGSVQYDAAFSAEIGGYPATAILAGTASGVLWLCTVDNNTSNPDTGGAGWVNIGTESSPLLVGADTGSANVMTATLSPAPGAYLPNVLYLITKVGTGNTGAMTGNVNSLGSRPIVSPSGAALTAGQWPANYDGLFAYSPALSSIIMLNPVSAGAENSLIHTGNDTGTTNRIDATVAPPITAYVEGDRHQIKLANAINGAGALANICGLGNRTITRADGTPTQAGDGGAPGSMLDLIDDGTNLQIAGLYTNPLLPTTVKAWVKFDATTTPPTVQAAYNVSSVTKLSTGHYVITFTNPMANANYVAAGMPGSNLTTYTGYYGSDQANPPTVNNFHVNVGNVNSPTWIDFVYNAILFF